jgi:hypothetical protein
VSRRAFGVLLLTGGAIAAATSFYRAGYPTPIYDGRGYYVLAGILRTHGLKGWPSGIRTYGYPFFTLVATGFRPLSPESFRLVVFVAQLLVYLAACAIAARRLGRIFDSPELGLAAYGIGALNPALLLQATEPITDLLSAALILVAVALAWRIPGEFRRGRTGRELLPSFLCAGAAMAIRPANLAVAAGLAAAWALRAWRWRDIRSGALLVAPLALIAPLVPQALIRRAQTGAALPLVDPGLYREQVGWGMRALKYATLVVDGRPPSLVYRNPLYRGASTPAEFAARDPLAYLGTLLLHAFGILDRDLPFTYVTDLHPWYQRPIAFANLFLVALAAAGVVLGTAGIVRRRVLDERAFVVVATTLVGGAYLAIYLPVAVEARFGAPLQAFIPTMIVVLLAILPAWSRPARRRLLAGASLAACAGLALSAWMERQRSNPPNLQEALSPGSITRPAAPALAPVPTTPEGARTPARR